MLTVALPKGRILAPFLAFCRQKGWEEVLAVEEAGRSLVVEVGRFRFLLLKDADVPRYVAEGVAQLGVAGLDQILEQEVEVLRLQRFPFGHCRLGLIVPQEGKLPDHGSPWRLASKYPSLASRLAERRGLWAEVVELSGSVELAARLGLADGVVDLVETGRTLRENGLVLWEAWLEVAPYLVANWSAWEFYGPELKELLITLGR